MPRLDWFFLSKLHFIYSSMWMVRVIRGQEEIRVVTFSFRNKEWAAVLDRLEDNSQSEMK